MVKRRVLPHQARWHRGIIAVTSKSERGAYKLGRKTREMNQMVAVFRKIIAVAAVSAPCPHCGAALSSPALRQDKVGETLGA